VIKEKGIKESQLPVAVNDVDQKAPKIDPKFRDEGIETNRSRIRAKSVFESVDKGVEHPNRTLDGRGSTITKDSLLIRLKRSAINFLRDVGSTKLVPVLGIARIWKNALNI
jgi:hypothetical protein